MEAGRRHRNNQEKRRLVGCCFHIRELKAESATSISYSERESHRGVSSSWQNSPSASASYLFCLASSALSPPAAPILRLSFLPASDSSLSSSASWPTRRTPRSACSGCISP